MNTQKKDTTYNGWTNYETWNVKLWIDNEAGVYDYWLESAKEFLKQAKADDYFTVEQRATLDLSECLKDHFESEGEDILEKANATASTWADLLHGALSEVNWHEIANALIDEAEQE